MGLWGLVGLLIVAALVALAVWAGIRLSRRGGGSESVTPVVSGDAALDRLRGRYADGEVDEEEFERRLAALNR